MTLHVKKYICFVSEKKNSTFASRVLSKDRIFIVNILFFLLSEGE